VSRKPARSKSAAKGAVSSEPKIVVRASNRRAFRNYVIEDKVEAGLVLLGSEVKSLRNSTPTLNEGFARFEGEELWLHNVHIHQLPQASYFNHDPTRKRKCLMYKRELRRLKMKLEAKGATIVPLSLYFKGTKVKVQLGVGRGRRKGDRRQADRDKEDRKKIRDASL